MQKPVILISTLPRDIAIFARAHRILTLCVAVVAATLAAGAAPAHAWKCCDQWGYDYPGVYATKNGCRDAGGVVYKNTLVCPNATLIFKCCDASGAPVPGVYSSPHNCKTAGHEVFPGVLQCPKSGPFQCCDPDGGGAPGIHLTRNACIADGYQVQEFTTNGCPGAWRDRLKEWWRDNRIAPFCALMMKNVWAPTGIVKDLLEVLPGGGGPDKLSRLLEPYKPYSNNDEHCTMSCLLAVECGERTARLAGNARELVSMCDGTNRNAIGTGDICANEFGIEYGAGLAFTDADAAAQSCVEYCTGITDLEDVCENAAELTSAFLKVPFTVIDNAMPASIFGLSNPLKGVWGKMVRKCDDGLLGGLTLPAHLPDVVHDLKTQGQSLIAAALNAGLEIGETASFDSGAIMTRSAAAEYLLTIHDSAEEIDAQLEYNGGRLQSVQLRGAGGQIVTMSMDDPVTTSCTTQPCEKRLGWSQWVAGRNRLPALREANP